MKFCTRIPAPPELTVEPSVIVTPDSVTTAPLATWKSWTALFPLIVTRLAPGPLSTIGPDGPLGMSVLDSVIVCGARTRSRRS